MRPPSALTFLTPTRTASRLSDLLAAGNYALDPAVLARQALCLPPAQLGETPYRGIDFQHQQAETPGPRDGSIAPKSPEEAATSLRGVLGDVVAHAIGGARRVAVLTGGGLDSAGLLALTHAWSRESGGSFFAVALDYAARGDDRPHLRALEQHLGCEVLRVAPADAGKRLEGVLRGIDGAPVCPPGAVTEIEALARAKANGAECVLSGIGGDHMFDGHPRVLAGVAERGRVVEALRMARRLRGFPVEPRSRTVAWIVRPLVARHTPAALRMKLARRGRKKPPDWTGPVVERLMEEQAERDLSDLKRAFHDRAPAPSDTSPEVSLADRMAIAWWRHQVEVAAGVERRDPFLDPAVGTFIRTLPVEWLLHGDIRRGLFRTAFEGLLPEPLRLREDKAYGEPSFIAAVAAAGGFERLRSLARDTELASLGIVDDEGFGAVFGRFLERYDREPWTVWYFLAVEAFLRARRGRSW